MKLRIFLPAVVLTVFLLLPAQLLSQNVKFGLKGGLNSSWVSEDPLESESVRGWSTAFFTEWQFAGRLSTILDLGVARRGFARVQNELNDNGLFVGEVKAKSQLTYFSIAPQLNVHLSKKHWRPYVGAGPRLDFLAGKNAGEFEFTTVTTRDDTVDMLDDVVFGAMFATGIKHGHRIGFQWKLELRFERDLSDSFEQFPGSFRNNTLALLMGISF